MDTVKLSFSQKFGMSFGKLLLKRIQSKSPSFYTELRKWCGIFIPIEGSIAMLFGSNAFGINPDTSTNIAHILAAVAAIIMGLGLGTYTGTTDPALMSPESKAAVANPIGPTEDGGAL